MAASSLPEQKSELARLREEGKNNRPTPNFSLEFSFNNKSIAFYFLRLVGTSGFTVRINLSSPLLPVSQKQ